MANWLTRLLLGAGDGKGGKRSGPTPVAEYRQTASGLQWCDLATGSGAAAARGDRVRVHYVGWLASGREFDSSRKRDKPFAFELGRRKVIKGWDEGVAGMRAGGVRQLRVPPALGYGAAGSPPVIPPKATLVFEVELLEVG